MGWCFIALNVLNNGNRTSFKAYQLCDNFVTFNSTHPVVTMAGAWQDADSHVFTVGAMNNNTKKATEFIEGIMHQVELFAYPLSLSQIHDQATCKDLLITFSPFYR